MKCLKSDGRMNGRVCAKCIKYFHDRCISSKNIDLNWHCNDCSRRKIATGSGTCVICLKADKRMTVIECRSCNQEFHKKHVTDIFLKDFADWLCNFCIFPFTNDDLLDYTPAPTNDLLLSPVLKSFDDTIKICRGLKVAHINIRSLRRTFSELVTVLKFHRFDIMFVSETFLNVDTNDHDMEIDTYTLIRKDRQRHGGGLIAYISDNMQFELLDTTALFCPIEEFECISVNIKLQQSNTINFSCLYRPPSSSLTTFIDNMHDYHRFIHENATELHILGDMNIDLMNDMRRTAYIRAMNSLGFKQIIDRPTRITLSSETLIDHILTNRNEYIIERGTLVCGMSDHDMIYMVRKKPHTKKEKKVISFRSLKTMNIAAFTNEVNNLPWNIVDCCDDSNDILDSIHKLLLPVVNMHCPIMKRSVQSKTSPWMTSEVLERIKTRDKLKKNYLKNKDRAGWEHYKRYRNMTNNCIHHAKKNYYRNKFTAAKDSDSIWKAYFDLVNKKEKTTTLHEIVVNGSSSSEHSAIATELSRAFAVKTQSNDSSVYEKVYDSSPPASLLISSKFIQKIIQRTKSNASPSNIIPPVIYKLGIESVNNALVKLFNHVFTSGDFPTQWKTAIVTPILKPKQNPKLPNSYRPISILPFLSKVLEKIMSIKLYSVTENKFSSSQYGFRKYLSTCHATANFTQCIHDELDKGKYVAAVYYDLTKAFDMVHHANLISKLENMYKIPKYLLNVIKSYLYNRYFCVKLNGKISDSFPLTASVPQGSCLGPLLFNLSFDDVDSSLTDATKTVKYADDVGCVLTGVSQEIVLEKIIKCTRKFDDWCRHNHMKINYGKTKFMFFKYSRSKCNTSNVPPTICVNQHENQYIERVTDFKYLGVTIDENMKFIKHLINVKTKVAQRLNNPRFNKRCIPPKSMNVIIAALVRSIIEYAIPVYCIDHELLCVTERRIEMFLNDYYKSFPTHMDKVNFPTIENLYKYHTLCFVNTIVKNDSIPEDIKSLFPTKYRERESKFSHHFVLPKYVKNAFKKSFQYRSVKLWNEQDKTDMIFRTHEDFKSRQRIKFSIQDLI